MRRQSEAGAAVASRKPHFEENLWSWMIPGSLGLTSGILSMTAGSQTFRADASIGFVFGVALCAYFILSKELRSVLLAPLLIGASVSAYFAAFLVPMFLPLGDFSGHFGNGEIPLLMIFEGGAVGGFVLSTAVLFTVRNRPTDARVYKIALGSVVSGLVGVLGWALGPTLGMSLWSVVPTSEHGDKETLHGYSLFLVWQSVMAVFIAFLPQLKIKRLWVTAPEARGTSATDVASEEKSLLNWKAFLFLLPILLFLILFRAIPIRKKAMIWQQAYRDMALDTPSEVLVPAIQPLKDDEAFILADIDGFHPGEPSSYQDLGRPFSIYHSLSYKKNQEEVILEIRQWPNPEWALHLAHYPLNFAPTFENPKHHAVITKFQSKVRTNLFERLPGFEHNPGGAGYSLYYMWPSVGSVITITYHAAEEHEEFLRLYLEKYPSSIK